MYELLRNINHRPEPFEFYTAEALWTDEHTSLKMLEFHLDETVDVSSRNAGFIDRSVEWIASRFEVGAKTSVADFGCGPGLYSIRLAENGADVTGIDFSARSILYAQDAASRKGLTIEYVRQNYLELETAKSFDLIVMIMCDYSALSPAQRKILTGKFYTLLKPGGSVLLDVYSVNAFGQTREVSKYEYNLLGGFWSSAPYYGFLNTFKYEEEKVVLDKYTIFEAARTQVIYNWLQYFSRGSLGKEFEQQGFIVEGFYSDVAGTPYGPDSNEFAIVAKKPR